MEKFAYAHEKNEQIDQTKFSEQYVQTYSSDSVSSDYCKNFERNFENIDDEKKSRNYDIKLPSIKNKNVDIIFSIKNNLNIKKSSPKNFNFYETIISKLQKNRQPGLKSNLSSLKMNKSEDSYLPKLNSIGSTSQKKFNQIEINFNPKHFSFVNGLPNAYCSETLKNQESTRSIKSKNTKLTFSNRLVNYNIISKLTEKINPQDMIHKEKNFDKSKYNNLSLLKFRKEEFLKKMEEFESKNEKIRKLMILIK